MNKLNLLIVLVIFVITAAISDELSFGTTLLISIPLALMCLVYMGLAAFPLSNLMKRTLIHFFIAGGMSGAVTIYALLDSSPLGEAVFIFVFVGVVSLVATFCIRLLKAITGINLFVLLDPFADFEG